MASIFSLSSHVEDFIESIGRADSLGLIFEALSKRLQELGFDYFSYWMTWSPEVSASRICITNYDPEWSRYYAEQGYVSDDFLAQYGATCLTPFLWEHAIKNASLTERQKLIFSEGANVGMRAGGTVPLHGPPHALALFSVANTASDEEFERLFNSRKHEIQLIATYAHEKILQLNILAPESDTGKERLTSKEREVLTWASRGKTNLDIATILNIQETTIKRHLENAREKMNATNTTHAIAKAIISRQLLPWPTNPVHTVNQKLMAS